MDGHTKPVTQAPTTSMYAGMSPEGLLQECERLQLLTTSQAQCIKNLNQSTSKTIEGLLQECGRLQLLTASQVQCNRNFHQSILKMIESWGRVIQAHYDQDDTAVHKELAVAIAKLKAPAEAYH